MDSTGCDAVVMPSRTILLKGIPRGLNNGETIHNYFSKFGAILWVNEHYEGDPKAAIVTFFSISDAIAAMMSDEHPMDFGCVTKSWFEYTKNCNFCSYKYSTECSIKQHMATHHPDRSENQYEIYEDLEITSNSIDINDSLHVGERAETCVSYETDNVALSAKDKERADNEVTSLIRKNTNLNEALNWTMKQRDLHQSEINTLNGKLDSMNSNHDHLQRDKQLMDNEFMTLKMKNEDLSDSLNRALEQRDLARSEVLALYAKLQELTAEKEDVEQLLNEKCQLFEQKNREFEQIKRSHDLVLKEKEHLENELNAQKDLLTENKHMVCEISELNAVVEHLKQDLRRLQNVLISMSQLLSSGACYDIQ